MPIPQLITYQKLIFTPKILENAKNFDDIKRAILLQAQGNNLILTSQFSLLTLLKIVELVYPVVAELVYENSSGEKFLVLNKLISNDIIQPGDVVNVLDKPEIFKQGDKLNEKSAEIDIEAIWHEAQGFDITDKIEESLRKIFGMLNTQNGAILLGANPPELFLITFAKLLNISKNQVFYMENHNSQKVRIK